MAIGQAVEAKNYQPINLRAIDVGDEKLNEQVYAYLKTYDLYDNTTCGTSSGFGDDYLTVDEAIHLTDLPENAQALNPKLLGGQLKLAYFYKDFATAFPKLVCDLKKGAVRWQEDVSADENTTSDEDTAAAVSEQDVQNFVLRARLQNLFQAAAAQERKDTEAARERAKAFAEQAKEEFGDSFSELPFGCTFGEDYWAALARDNKLQMLAFDEGLAFVLEESPDAVDSQVLEDIESSLHNQAFADAFGEELFEQGYVGFFTSMNLPPDEEYDELFLQAGSLEKEETPEASNIYFLLTLQQVWKDGFGEDVKERAAQDRAETLP